MKQRAFTLLETVVALAIAVVVMGAALTANRVVQKNAQLAAVATQEEAILSDTVDTLTLTSNALRQTGTAFGSVFAGLGANATIRIAPYRFRQQTPLAVTDPQVVKWCTPSDVTGCNALFSTAGPTNATFKMSDALSEADGEVIAVRKTAPASGQPQLFDFMYLPASGSVGSTTLFADNTASQADWDFYRRIITIQNRSTLYAGYVITIKVSPVLDGVTRTGSGVSRTIVFTDY